MPLVWKDGRMQESPYPDHDPEGCDDCAFYLAEYGMVLVDPTKTPPRHRGWYEGVHTKPHYQRIKAREALR